MSNPDLDLLLDHYREFVLALAGVDGGVLHEGTDRAVSDFLSYVENSNLPPEDMALVREFIRQKRLASCCFVDGAA